MNTMTGYAIYFLIINTVAYEQFDYTRNRRSNLHFRCSVCVCCLRGHPFQQDAEAKKTLIVSTYPYPAKAFANHPISYGRARGSGPFAFYGLYYDLFASGCRGHQRRQQSAPPVASGDAYNYARAAHITTQSAPDTALRY